MNLPKRLEQRRSKRQGCILDRLHILTNLMWANGVCAHCGSAMKRHRCELSVLITDIKTFYVEVDERTKRIDEKLDRLAAGEVKNA